MQHILAFDTSAAHCAAALLSGDTCTTRIEAMPVGQAERLLPLLEDLLAGVGIGWRDLAALGVGCGPGNFTGTRIAVAAARGLALALGIPAVGVTTFEALALGRDCTVVQDARRGMVYAQRFADGSATGAAVMVAQDAPLPFDPGAVMTGDLAGVQAPRHGARAVAPTYPLPEAIARIARSRHAGAVARPAPLYLRPADAAPPRGGPPVILPG
ncbi:MAG: tRNA (adenosine(37)-N6)-threonylcarbamoyltransferase complex dimerization subunit type 1 TsaB [Rubellimicrobium sp.]|nr:tRNA (adenosine(37)-N6)-threonylcarbamoyltransferase complex dimerization subunit type 1 TsaB [Rubellimicrobium sp.]